MRYFAFSRREILAAALGAAALPGPHDDRWRDVREFIDGARAAGSFPGAALIASRRGTVKINRHVGTYCGLGGRALGLDGSVAHPLYSFSKLVSATVVAMVVTDGLLE